MLSGSCCGDCTGLRETSALFLSETVDGGSGLAFFAVVGRLAGRRPAFTRETARTSQHRSFYSNAKISNRYPDFRFHTLEETVGYIKNIRERGLIGFQISALLYTFVGDNIKRSRWTIHC